MLPDASLPLLKCDSLGQSLSQAMAASTEQSPAFSDFVANSPLLAASDIKVEILQFGASSPVVAYPDSLTNLTAGDWNTAALLNNRVRFILKSDSQAEPESIWSVLFGR